MSDFETALNNTRTELAIAIRHVMEGAPDDGPLKVAQAIDKLIMLRLIQLRDDIQDSIGVRP